MVYAHFCEKRSSSGAFLLDERGRKFWSMKITQDVHRNVATIHDAAGAGASGNGSNGQALTASMTQISKKLQHWVAKFMFAWIRC
jgi:hypothetical protein